MNTGKEGSSRSNLNEVHYSRIKRAGRVES